MAFKNVPRHGDDLHNQSTRKGKGGRFFRPANHNKLRAKQLVAANLHDNAAVAGFKLAVLVFERMPLKHLVVAGSILLAAAPGEAIPTMADVPALAKAAVARRIDVPASAVHISSAKPSERMPGFVVCGRVDTSSGANGGERFFVIIPGDFAILDQDGKSLVDSYWSANHCE